MTTPSTKRVAMIVERNGVELARDVLHLDIPADAHHHFMRLVRKHEIDPFDEPVNCRVEELSE
jgi:hypothetical protein